MLDLLDGLRLDEVSDALRPRGAPPVATPPPDASVAAKGADGGLDPGAVLKSSIEVPFHKPQGGQLRVRVMNPVHCLLSRAHNVMGLPEKYDNAHGILQLRAAIVCARAYVKRLADAAVDGGKCRNALRANEKLFEFSVNEEQAHAVHGIEVFEAVSNTDSLPERFRSLR